MRSDFGVGLANPTELGGFEEFFEVCPSRAASPAIRTRATPSSADNNSISSSRRANHSQQLHNRRRPRHREIITIADGQGQAATPTTET